MSNTRLNVRRASACRHPIPAAGSAACCCRNSICCRNSSGCGGGHGMPSPHPGGRGPQMSRIFCRFISLSGMRGGGGTPPSSHGSGSSTCTCAFGSSGGIPTGSPGGVGGNGGSAGRCFGGGGTTTALAFDGGGLQGRYVTTNCFKHVICTIVCVHVSGS